MDSDMPKTVNFKPWGRFEYIHHKNFQEYKAEFIKGLEAEIGDELRTRINKIKGRLILLVGKSVKASEAAGRYAYCIKGHTILNFYSCSGKTDERIENILNDSVYYDGKDKLRTDKLVDCLSSGGTVFLDNLKCHDMPLLERLADEIRNVKNKNYDKGMLIVSTTTDRDSVPEYFTELFEGEVIELEPEKQARQETPASTPQDTPEPQKQGNVFRWCGGTWEITFDGKTIRPPDSFGLKYIHYLLKHPDQEIYATELRLITGTQLRERSNKSYDEEKKDNEESSGIESGDKMNKILDSTSIEEIKRAIGYLSEQSVGAEEEERAELLDKKTVLELYLKKATNINADSRDFSTDWEKARKAVSKCITNSLEIINKEHTTLEQYLSTTIKMGNVSQYKHTSKIDWQLS